MEVTGQEEMQPENVVQVNSLVLKNQHRYESDDVNNQEIFGNSRYAAHGFILIDNVC
jgi:hypothetical protein